eukprot:10796460-Alexandrium_andersonii.AAC.1
MGRRTKVHEGARRCTKVHEGSRRCTKVHEGCPKASAEGAFPRSSLGMFGWRWVSRKTCFGVFVGAWVRVSAVLGAFGQC